MHNNTICRHTTGSRVKRKALFLMCCIVSIWMNASIYTSSSDDEVEDEDQVISKAALDDARPPESPANPTTFANTTSSPPFNVFPLPRVEDWLNDIGTDRPAPCGAKKCVFESKSSTSKNSDANRKGYMVSQWMLGRQQNTIKSLQRGWKKSQRLASDFGIQNVLLGPPETFHNVSKEFVERLNQNTYASVKDTKTYKAQNQEGGNIPLFVQPVLIVPSSSIFFGCEPNRIHKAYEQLHDWRTKRGGRVRKDQDRKATPRTTTTVASGQYNDESGGSIQLIKDLNTTLEILLSPQGECLLTDFQVFVDPELPTERRSDTTMATSIFHIDVDRCFERRHPTNPTLGECAEALQTFVKAVVTAQEGLFDLIQAST